MTGLGAVFDRIRHGVAGVCAAQGDDGAWSDFEIAGMGASGPWVTAAVGLRLATLPPAFRDAAVARAVDRAVRCLEAEPTWSYNHKAPADADTIAHALLLLGTAGRTRAGAVEQLLGFQTLDGGFSTFAPNARGAAHESWSMSHPDVTPVAVRALCPHRERSDVAAAISRALERRTGDLAAGRWPAFWWGLDWYTAAAWARASSELGIGWEPPPRPALGPLRAPLDAAYLLEVALASGWEAIALTVADVLISGGGDGPLWPPVPVLRVTAPHVARPWELSGDQGGRLYTDVRGIYSTSIIVSALASYAERFATG
jgi:hypothetical protein